MHDLPQTGIVGRERVVETGVGDDELDVHEESGQRGVQLLSDVPPHGGQVHGGLDH